MAIRCCPPNARVSTIDMHRPSSVEIPRERMRSTMQLISACFDDARHFMRTLCRSDGLRRVKMFRRLDIVERRWDCFGSAPKSFRIIPRVSKDGDLPKDHQISDCAEVFAVRTGLGNATFTARQPVTGLACQHLLITQHCSTILCKGQPFCLHTP